MGLYRIWHYRRKRLLLLGLPLLLLIGGGGAYAAIQLNAPPVMRSTPQTAIQIGSLEKGLVGEWKLNGNGKDSTPYGHDATATGTPAPTVGPTGQPDTAMAFNGSSDYFSTSGASLNGIMLQGSYTSSWTLSIWAKANTFTSRDALVLGRYGNNGGIVATNDGFSFELHSDPNGDNKFYRITGSATHTGQWYMLTAVYASGGMSFFVNGQQAGTRSIPSLNPYGTLFCIGGMPPSGFDFSGSLSDARVYNRALSASEVQQLYDSYNSQINLGVTTAPSGQSVSLTKGLVGYWPFNGNARDTTPYSDDGTVHGATLTDNRFGQANSAYNFDGNSYIQIPGSATFDDFGTDPFSIALWVKTTTTSWGSFIDNKYAGTNDAGFNWQINGVTYFRIANGVTQYNVQVGESINDGEWHLLVGERTVSGLLQVYLDGVPAESNSVPATFNISNSRNLYIGAYSPGSGSLTGSIDDVRIYNRALNADEVAALYNLRD